MVKYKELVAECSVVLTQPADTCSDKSLTDEMTDLRITVLDGGGGPFIRIKTDEWAIDPDEIDEFAAYLKKLLKKVNPA